MPTQTVCVKCNAPLEGTAEFCPECGAKPEDRQTPVYKVVIIAAIAVIILGALFVISNMSKPLNRDSIIYFKDESLYISAIAKNAPLQLTDGLNDVEALTCFSQIGEPAPLLLSDNGRYLFFAGQIGENHSGFTFYWRDLKADPKKAAVKIDSDISPENSFLSVNGNSFIYKKNDNRLYIYDRKTHVKTKISDDVQSFSANNAGNYILLISGGALYEYTVMDAEWVFNKLDSDISDYQWDIENKKVYYKKEDILYCKEAGIEKTKISSGAASIVSAVRDGSLYYTKTERVRKSLSEFIIDDMLAEDSKINPPPAEPDFGEPPAPPKRIDFIKNTPDFRESPGESPYSGGYADGDDVADSDIDMDAYSAALEAYQVLLNEWSARKEEYRKASGGYLSKMLRDEFRSALKDSEIFVEYDTQSLIYHSGGSESLISSNISHIYSASSKVPAVVYGQISESPANKLLFSEFLSDLGLYSVGYKISELENRSCLNGNKGISEVYAAYCDTGLPTTETDAPKEGEPINSRQVSDDGIVYYLAGYDAEKLEGTLMSYNLTDSKSTVPVMTDSGVSSFFLGNDSPGIYYFKDNYDNRADLYRDGNLIATGVYPQSIYNFKGSGTLIYYVDFDSEKNRGTLCIYKSGKESRIAGDVSCFAPINENNIAFLEDYSFNTNKGELFLYSGKDANTLVDSGVGFLYTDPELYRKNQIK